MDWKEASVPIQAEALGVRKITSFNHTLLGKSLWHYAFKRDSLWDQWVPVGLKNNSSCGLMERN